MIVWMLGYTPQAKRIASRLRSHSGVVVCRGRRRLRVFVAFCCVAAAPADIASVGATRCRPASVALKSRYQAGTVSTDHDRLERIIEALARSSRHEALDTQVGGMP